MVRGVRGEAWPSGVIARSIERCCAIGLMFAAILALGVEPGCKAKGKAPEGMAPPQGYVPAPSGLVAEICIASPEPTYQRLRSKAPGPTAFLPTTFPSLVATLLHLPVQAIELIDANLPVHGVVSEPSPGSAWEVVIGVHLRDASRFVEILTTGQEPKFSSIKHPSGVITLEPIVKPADAYPAIGVSDHYLVVGQSRDGLVADGPFVSRMLSVRPKPSGEIVAVLSHRALAGPVVNALQARWSAFKKEREREDVELRQQHGGREPDFADPAAAVAGVDDKVARLAAMLGDLENARIEVRSDDTGIHARLRMIAATGGGVASQEIGALAVGDALPLLDLPSGSLFSFLVRDSVEQRRSGVKEQADGLRRLFGSRLPGDEAAKIENALNDWAAGRGDWTTAAVQWSAKTQALVIRGSVTDRNVLERAFAGIVALPKIGALREPIEQFVGKLTVGKPVTRGNLTTVRLKRERMSRNRVTARSEIDVAWEIGPEQPLFRLVATSNIKSWNGDDRPHSGPSAADSALSQTVRGLGNDVSFALVIEPFKLIAGISGRSTDEASVPSSPLLFSYGRSQSVGWFQIDLPYAVASEVMRLAARKE